MSIALDHFCCILLFMMPFQVELSTYIGVASCGCQIYFNVFRTTMSSIELIKRGSHYALEADAITFLIVYDMERIAPLFSLWLEFSSPLKQSPPDWLRA